MKPYALGNIRRVCDGVIEDVDIATGRYVFQYRFFEAKIIITSNRVYDTLLGAAEVFQDCTPIYRLHPLA